MELGEAIKEVKNQQKRKFVESIDLIINLKGIDLKRDTLTAIVTLPHKIRDKKICGFLSKKSDIVKTITPPDFPKFKEKKAIRSLVKEFDFFIASAQLMPSVATNFGKVLGPTGKMPSPQLGMITQENEDAIRAMVEKISKSIKIRLREASVKTAIGKENMPDEVLIENAMAIYNSVVNILPTKKENIRSIMIKKTMGKPIKVEIK